MGHKQARALHKLAHLLHTEQPVGKLTSTQLTQAYIEQHGIRHIAAAHRPLVTSTTYEAPKRPQPLATLPETLARAKHAPAPDAPRCVPAACLTHDLTLPSGKRRKHDAAALGHRTALEPLNTSTLGAGGPQTQRTYLARNERVQLHIYLFILFYVFDYRSTRQYQALLPCRWPFTNSVISQM